MTDKNTDENKISVLDWMNELPQYSDYEPSYSTISSISDLDFAPHKCKTENKATFLDYLVPPHVAEIARLGIPIEPEMYENTCILFSDLASFMEMSSSVEPELILNLIDKLHIVIDRCIKFFPDLYKVGK